MLEPDFGKLLSKVSFIFISAYGIKSFMFVCLVVWVLFQSPFEETLGWYPVAPHEMCSTKIPALILSIIGIATGAITGGIAVSKVGTRYTKRKSLFLAITIGFGIGALAISAHFLYENEKELQIVTFYDFSATEGHRPILIPESKINNWRQLSFVEVQRRISNNREYIDDSKLSCYFLQLLSALKSLTVTLFISYVVFFSIDALYSKKRL